MESIRYQRFGVKLIPLTFLVCQYLRIKTIEAIILIPRVSSPSPSFLHMGFQPLETVGSSMFGTKNFTSSTSMSHPHFLQPGSPMIDAIQSFTSHPKCLLRELLQHPDWRRRPLVHQFTIFINLHSQIINSSFTLIAPFYHHLTPFSIITFSVFN